MRIRMDLKLNIRELSINRIVRYLVVVDLMLWGGWGLFAPIFAVFILDRIPGATLITIGAVSALYWTVKSIIQIPIALFLDRRAGERDDFYTVIMALILAGFTAISFLLVHTIPGLFLVTFLQAVAFGIYIPAWSGIFSRHLDKNHYSFDWSLDSTSVGFAYGVTALVGGSLAALLGFETVFILASVISFTSAVVLFFAPNLILPKPIVKSIAERGVPLSEHPQ